MHDAPRTSARARTNVALAATALALGLFAVACSDSATAPKLGPITQSTAADSFFSPLGVIGAQVPLSGSPWGVAISSQELAYVTQLDVAQMAITSTTSKTINGEVNVGSVPTAVAFAPDGNTAYVTNQGDGTLGVVNVASGVQSSTVAMPQGVSPFAVVVAPKSKQIFVSGNGVEVYSISAAKLKITDSITVGAAGNAFAVSPDEKTFFVSSFSGATVTQFNIKTHAVVRTFNPGGTPQGLSTNKAGTQLFVANEGGFVSIFDIATGNLVNTLTLTAGGFGTAVTPDDKHLYISEPGAGIVQVVNLQTGTVGKTITVGGEPRRIAFNPSGKIAIVANHAGYITFIR